MTASPVDDYTRLAAREREAKQTLANARKELETARERDVAAVAKACRDGKGTPSSSEEHQRDVIASTELLLAGLDRALEEVSAEIVAEIEQSRERKVSASTLHIAPLDERPSSGEAFTAYVTGYFNRADRKYEAGQAKAQRMRDYEAAIEAVNDAKGVHRRAGRPEHTFVAADYVDANTLAALRVPGGFGRLYESGVNMPVPKQEPERWRQEAEEAAAFRHSELVREAA
jgi:hypothetical protein